MPKIANSVVVETPMKNRYFGSGIVLLACAGLAMAQDAQSPYRAPESTSQLPGTAKGDAGAKLPAPGGNGKPQLPSSGTIPPPTPAAKSQPTPSTTLPGGDELPANDPPGRVFSFLEGPWSSPRMPYATSCWIAPEYLLWRVKQGPLPVPLLLSNPQDPDLSRLRFGNTDLDYGNFSGGRLTVGGWCDDRAVFGIEARGFLLAQGTTSNTFASRPQGAPFLGIPFFNTSTQQEDFLPISIPGAFAGTLDVSSSTRLWGLESSLLFNLYRDTRFSLDVLAGGRYLELRENLTINNSFAALPGFQVAFGGNFFDPPNLVTTSDSFSTKNRYFGGQLGLRTEWHLGNFSASVTGKIALGDTREVSDVNGYTTLNSGLVPRQTLPGGIFALTSNIGRLGQDTFAVVPEVEVKLGYQLTSNLSVFVGYNFMYWSSLARPGDQINRFLNPGLIPSANDFGLIPGPGPQAFIRTTDFWAQGLNAGIEIRY
jgi:hypothetical protein